MKADPLDIDRRALRRRINLKIALKYAKAGIYVYPSIDKTPLIPDWPRPDNIPLDTVRAERVEKYRDTHGTEPAHIGCTTDEDTVRKLWAKYPDAVPSLSLGPSGLFVLDPDSKNDGPKKLGDWFKQHGGLPHGVAVTRTQSGGRHIFFKNTIEHGNKSGRFKSDLGTDVKAIGGQVVAPGAIREDGARYTSDPKYPDLAIAFLADTLPPVPDFVAEYARATPAAKESDAQKSDSDVGQTIRRLRETDWPDADTLHDPLLGYDLDTLRQKDTELNDLLDNPTGDRSKDRWRFARCVLREWRNMPAEDYAALVSSFDWAGEFVQNGTPKSGQFDFRQLAREYCGGRNEYAISEGDAFAAVDDIGEAPAETAAAIRALRTLKSDRALGLIDDRAYSERRKSVVSAARDTGRAIRERIADIKRIAGIETPDDDETDDEREPAKSTRRGVSVSELTARGFQPVEYLWPDLLAANTVTMVYGHAGASKTSLVINEAMPHAFGFDREGNPIERFGTIFVALESVDDTHNLILAWLRANPQYRTFGTEAAFTVVNGVGWGLHDRQLKKTELERHLEKEIKEFPLRFGVQPRVVVIDTAAMAVISDSGEETNECVNRTLSAANRVLGKLTRGAVVFLGHTGKDEKTYRGAVSWLQGTQGFVRMERRGGRVTVSVERLKGAASGGRFTCQSNAVPMGVTDSLGREAVAYVLTGRSCTSNPNVPSDGRALIAADDEATEAAPVLPEPQEAPASTPDERKAQEIAALADEACAVLAAIGRPLKRAEWDAEIQAKRLEGVKGRKERERISGPPERKMDRAIGRLIAERRIRRAGSARATLYELTG